MSATKFVITQCTVTLNVLTEVDKNYSPVNVPRSCGCLIGQFFFKTGKRESEKEKCHNCFREISEDERSYYCRTCFFGSVCQQCKEKDLVSIHV